MIVISGALVLVALVLLVIGIVGPELGFVYASIAVSLVSLVFLVIGILQRRGETLPGAPAAPAPTARVDDPAQELTAVLPTGSRPLAAASAPLAADDLAGADLEAGGSVLVVAGRPRYHVAGCRYLSGKDAEAVDVLAARDEGFTPCGVCRPDDALAAQADAPAPVLEAPAPLALEEVEASSPTRVAKAPVTSRRTTAAKAPARTATKAPARTAATTPARAPRVAPEPLVAPAVVVPAVLEPALVEPAAAPVAEAAPVRRAAKTAQTAKTAKTASAVPAVAAVKATRTTAKAPAKAAATARATKAPVPVPADVAPAPAARAGSVVVIPDRGRYHRPECRYVRGVEGAEVLSKTAATRQGYEACGVCKP